MEFTKMRRLIVLMAWITSAPADAFASAWPVRPGEGQVIVKYEAQYARQWSLTPDQLLVAQDTSDKRISLFGEIGVTKRITLQFQGGLARGSDASGVHDGFAPASIGLRYAAFEAGNFVLSGYFGATLPGVQLSNRFDPSPGDGNIEMRGLAGWSGRLLGRDTFVDLEVARLTEFGEQDQTRSDLTVGRRITSRWLAMLQVYAGQTDGGGLTGSRWIKLDQTFVCRLGRWNFQSGWRQTLWGQNIPMAQGPVVALWRKF